MINCTLSDALSLSERGILASASILDVFSSQNRVPTANPRRPRAQVTCAFSSASPNQRFAFTYGGSPRQTIASWASHERDSARRTSTALTEATTLWNDLPQPPSWHEPLMRGVSALGQLPPNWDSYGAVPPDARIVARAVGFISRLLGPASPAPFVVPLATGGLQMEWHRNDIDLEVVFDRDEQPFFYCRNRISSEESEHELPNGSHLLREILSSLK